MFEELENLEKQEGKRKQFPKNAKCYVCGDTYNNIRLRRFNNYCLCTKHYMQLIKYKKITDPTSRQHRKENIKCCICGEIKMGSYNDKPYCRKHYLQMSRYGKVFPTIFDPNEWIDCGDYMECILKDKKGIEIGRTKIDKQDYPILRKYKLYMRHQSSKNYAMFSVRGTSRKYLVHRFLFGMQNEKFSIDKVVDHINGDSLDNRRSNLRVCTQHQNSLNGRKKGKIVGVKFIPSYNGTEKSKWEAGICSNYKNIYLGYYNTQEEAILARLKKEKELCGEYGPNKDLYYIINHPSPIEEISKVLNTFKVSLDGV